ncbi:Aspartate-semialdehyde dehydrogenase [hydrothermal vent metagenome]|uniref:aspartate-semialdehyde dehydrogenase n=1 Tax=hydrothermal vent metagenome TaxID=652676 RepID=A0A3B0S3D2_9ZZZZ
MSINVAIIGATGNVGREMLSILAERLFPVAKVHVLASRKSLGREVSFGDKTLKCENIETFDFSKVGLVLMATNGEMAKQWAPRIARDGALVIDNSSAFRMADKVPLIVPEVNPDAILGAKERNIVANPNCSTIQLMVALKPIHDAVGIKRVNVSTYQSTSGAGKDAMDELWNQTRALFVTDPVEPVAFPKRIAFNVIPQVDVFLDDGSGDTREEQKMVQETGKILDPAIKVNVTCVRVPVFVGHSEAVNIELAKAMSADEARSLLRESPGLMVIDKHEDGGYVTPVEIAGEFAVYVSRIRQDNTVKHGLNMWVVADNLRKGAALNAVQIAELALNRGMLTG